MRSEHTPLGIYDLTWLCRIGADLANQLRIVALRHETDVLRIVFFGDRQADLSRDLPHFLLRRVSEREGEARKLVTGSREEKVTLIAGRIRGAVKFRATLGFDAANIMTGGQYLRAQFATQFQ